jgi:hypothetical protein
VNCGHIRPSVYLTYLLSISILQPFQSARAQLSGGLLECFGARERPDHFGVAAYYRGCRWVSWSASLSPLHSPLSSTAAYFKNGSFTFTSSPMISPPAAVSTPAAGDPSVNRTTSARRRGLSYLRALSHNRSSGGTSPNEHPSRSPRHYFQRSLSYNDNRPDPAATRRRSISRPNEPTIPLSPDLRQVDTRSPSPRVAGAAPALDVPIDQVEQDPADEMARHRSSTSRRNASNSRQADIVTAATPEAAPRPTNPRNTSKSGTHDGEAKQQLPTIRFFPHQEIRNGRPSLNFSPIARTLPSEHSIIRVGRYSEREGVPSANPTGPSDAPVGFKSKVVSRKHCEFSFLDGQWQIKDVASSSGTFLNHIRLSQPNTESRLFPIKDGDIIQLGIDFRGGEEMIFRCVKIRIECNRAWQKKANNFK